MSTFETLLIEEVKKYRNLYDPSHKDYKDIAKSYADWESITYALRLPGKVSYVKSKWRSLRDGYARARRKRLYGHWVGKAPRYRFFRELDFLKDFIKHKDEDRSLSPPSLKTRKKESVEDDQDLGRFKEREFCSSGLWVPDVILKEENPKEEENSLSSLKAARSSVSLNDASSSHESFQPKEEHEKTISEPEELLSDREEKSIAPARRETFPEGVLTDLRTLLWGAQKHLDEDDAFGLFVAAALRKYPRPLKSEVKLKIQQIFHEIDLKGFASSDNHGRNE